MKNRNRIGLLDIIKAFQQIRLPLLLAFSDIRQRYRRSSLGPFWITLSMGVTIACIGLIFGNIFKAPMKQFLPFVSTGLIIWTFILTCLNESTVVFPQAQAIIKQLPIPLTSHVLRLLFRNFYILLHNLLVLPIVFLFVKKTINLSFFLCIPGFLLLFANLFWIALLLGIICTRFRDLSQLVSSVLQIFFYVTPIIWMPTLLPQKAASMVLGPNPFFHLISIVRDPLLGEIPSFLSYGYACGLFIFGSTVTLWAFNKLKDKIAYWL